MDAFSTYKLYVSLKLHFTKPDYNYFKNSPKVTAKSFVKRNDYYYFTKICEIYNDDELLDFFVSQLIVDSNFWIGDGFDRAHKEIYNQHKCTKDALTRRLETDMALLHTYSKTELYDPIRGYPKIISLYLGGKIRIETLVLLDVVNNWVTESKHMVGIVGDPLLVLIRKYRPFLYYYDIKKLQVIIDTCDANHYTIP